MKIILKLLFLLCLISTSVTACGKDEVDNIIGGNGNNNSQEIGITPNKGTTLYGVVFNEKDSGIPGVIVSDGYSCVETDQRGVYQIKRNEKAVYVFISIPAEYEIPQQAGYGSYPDFYKPAKALTGDTSKPHRVDFKLQSRKEVNEELVIVAMGDPQPDEDSHSLLFRNETIADIRKEIQAYKQPKVALSMGDVVGKDDGKGSRLKVMKGYFGELGIPFFTTVGNHDKSDGGKDYGEVFSNIFGPLYYSFNIGKTHFICLDDIMFHSTSNKQDYSRGISDEQLKWLKQDLSFVPEDRLIVLYYHAPFYSQQGKDKNIKEVFDLLKPYKELLQLSGHTHCFRPHTNTGYNRFEHILGASCGYYWRSKVGADGVPNGYVVFEVKGNKVVNSRFKATNRDPKHQIRLYKGNETYSDTYKYDYGDDYIVANVFFAGMGGKNWKIEVFENGKKSGDMELVTSSTVKGVVGEPGDMWVSAYHETLPYNYQYAACFHLFKYRLKNKNATVKVVATDTFGNTYEQTNFSTKDDYSEAKEY